MGDHVLKAVVASAPYFFTFPKSVLFLEPFISEPSGRMSTLGAGSALSSCSLSNGKQEHCSSGDNSLLSSSDNSLLSQQETCAFGPPVVTFPLLSIFPLSMVEHQESSWNLVEVKPNSRSATTETCDFDG